MSWIEDEPDRVEQWRELKRLLRRGRVRPVRTIALTLLLTLAAAGMRARRPHSFTSTVVLRVTEGDLDSTAPPPNRQLRAYVENVIFSSARLRELLESHRLYPQLLERDPDAAVAVLRSKISLEVWRNYFLLGRDPGDPPRSARIAVSMQASDPQLALAVAKELGRLIVSVTEAERVGQSERAAEAAGRAVSVARLQLDRAQQQLMRLELEPPRGLARKLELFDLQQTEARLESEWKSRSQLEANLRLRAALERHSMGIEFQLVDGGRAAPISGFGPVEMAGWSVVMFALLLPWFAVAVGAFDSRVDQLDDVRRLGLHTLGHVGSLPVATFDSGATKPS